MGKKTIELRGLSVNYGKKRILTNIFASFMEGHIYGIIGPNGAGKSTLFASILKQVVRIAGHIEIFGDAPEKQLHRIAFVPQKDEVDWSFPTTVMEVVLQGRYPHKRVWQRLGKDDRKIASDSLEKLQITHLADRQIGKLSGGQQQRVFIARALCQQADCFLLDEPFTGVDKLTEGKIIDILKSLKEAGKTILVVHHDLSTVKEYFDRVLLLNQRLIVEGPVDEVFTPEKIRETFGGQFSVLQKAGLLHD
ncbi:MAG: metal ABC transporter ATP-binding protein [Saprospirales bacterium]|nr:MAG: metal ABC transporter ATP-binding protein [Saprospirales bacterium]